MVAIISEFGFQMRGVVASPFMTISIFKQITVPLTILAGFAFGIPAYGAAGTVTGTAVYYSDAFNGKPVSAKGEKYDRTALTAATHGSFPIGSSVKVTNLANQKSIVVKVGPCPRTLDVVPSKKPSASK